MNLGVKSNMFNALLIQLKMDEFSGTRLYNHADDPKRTFFYTDVSGISWVYYQETIEGSTAQFTDSINYMFCNKENYTYVGDHCEYFECHYQCYITGRIGHCRGWTNTECAFLNVLNSGIVYDSTYNDYLACYKYCTNCVSPYINT